MPAPGPPISARPPASSSASSLRTFRPRLAPRVERPAVYAVRDQGSREGLELTSPTATPEQTVGLDPDSGTYAIGLGVESFPAGVFRHDLGEDGTAGGTERSERVLLDLANALGGQMDLVADAL